MMISAKTLRKAIATGNPLTVHEVVYDRHGELVPIPGGQSFALTVTGFDRSTIRGRYDDDAKYGGMPVDAVFGRDAIAEGATVTREELAQIEAGAQRWADENGLF